MLHVVNFFIVFLFFFVFFFKQKTAYDMRISDWSSDVCSSDLSYREARNFGHVRFASGENHYTRFEFNYLLNEGVVSIWQPDLSKSGGITEGLRIAAKIGRASCRERVCQYV